jgi:4-amino-4-deoxy-L-arabinose transferase-like glycosyltransferase
MRELLGLLKRHKRFFLLVSLAGLALRLYFVVFFPHVEGDTFIYGDIAKAWLTQGIYGLTDATGATPTLIRLPGYPGFLAAVFSIFGMEHYNAVLVIQALVDLNTCLVIAALALELAGERAAMAAYFLAALCPFTAMYSAAALAETLAIFCTAHALYYGVRGMKTLQSGTPGMRYWTLAGIWTALGIFMRPDSGIVLASLGLALLVLLVRSTRKKLVLAAGTVLVVSSLLPLVPWTVRNWRVFHVFQPLAPASATAPGESDVNGFGHWVRTWMADYVSVEEVEWPVAGEPVDFHALPERAFDSRLEYEKTRALISDYNRTLTIDESSDRKFDQLARERIAHNPFRYYIWLPLLRISDMWLRPRTELLPIETRWWEFDLHTGESWFALFWAALNLFYLMAALRGWIKHRLGVCGVALIGYVILRSAFLAAIAGPEPRYVLECFPIVIALAGAAFAKPGLSQK